MSWPGEWVCHVCTGCKQLYKTCENGRSNCYNCTHLDGWAGPSIYLVLFYVSHFMLHGFESILHVCSSCSFHVIRFAVVGFTSVFTVHRPNASDSHRGITLQLLLAAGGVLLERCVVIPVTIVTANESWLNVAVARGMGKRG